MNAQTKAEEKTKRWSLIMKLGHRALEIHFPNIYDQEEQWNDKSGMIRLLENLLKTSLCCNSVNWHQGLNSNNIW